MNERETQIYRELTGEEKLKAASRLYWSVRTLKLAALKNQHPDWTEEQLVKETRRLLVYAGT